MTQTFNIPNVDGEKIAVHVYRDPENQSGIRPTLACADRLRWFACDRIPELEQFAQREHPPMEYTKSQNYACRLNEPGIIPALSREYLAALIEAAKQENPERIKKLTADYMDAFYWERRRYGNVAAMLTSAKGRAA